MAKNKNVEISLEEKLKKALISVDEQPYAIPSNWVWTRYDVLFSDISKNEKKIEEKNYLENGEIAIVSQGKDKIVGYSDILEVKPYKEELPLIIFGDHTLNVKYIEFPFYIGADGVKVLKTTDIIIPKFLFYLLNNLKTFSLINTGYRRHYPILKKLFFPLPPLNEQKRIVEKLDFLFEKTKRAKEIIEEIKVDIENRKISILDRAFKGTLTSKWRNENKTSDVKELLKSINEEKIKKWEEDCLQAEKDGNKKPKKPTITEVKDMIIPVDEQPYKLPDSWVWVKLGDIGKITSGGTPTSNEKSYYGGDIIWITPADMSKQQSSPWFSNSSKKITNLGLQKSSAQLIEGNSVVYSSRAPIGYVNIVKDKFTTSQGCKSVTPIKNSLMYIYYVLIERTEDIKYRASGTTFKEISALEFGKTLVPLPPLEEQQEIVRVLDEVLENENKVKELLELEERIDILEKSILHKAFKGELGTQNNSDESALELLKNIL